MENKDRLVRVQNVRSETRKANNYYKYLLHKYSFSNTNDKIYNYIAFKPSDSYDNNNQNENASNEILERLNKLEKS